MPFHESAENIRLDDGHILRAQLRNGNGDLVDAEIDLNTVLGNSNGTFICLRLMYEDDANDHQVAFNGEVKTSPVVLKTSRFLSRVVPAFQSFEPIWLVIRRGRTT